MAHTEYTALSLKIIADSVDGLLKSDTRVQSRLFLLNDSGALEDWILIGGLPLEWLPLLREMIFIHDHDPAYHGELREHFKHYQNSHAMCK